MGTRFKEKSNQDLVDIFNNEVGNPGWGSTRAKFLSELREEMLGRAINFSLVAQKDSLQLSKKIILMDDKIAFDMTNEIKLETYTAKLNIGLQKNYDNTYYAKSDYIQFLQEYQTKLITEKGIHLSAAVQEFELVYGNLVEKHLVLNFVNYPKFPLEINIFKKNINLLGKKMMEQFNQNRIMIEYPDETIVFEIDPKNDPKISL